MRRPLTWLMALSLLSLLLCGCPCHTSTYPVDPIFATKKPVEAQPDKSTPTEPLVTNEPRLPPMPAPVIAALRQEQPASPVSLP
jgi:hypothetical protein